jgi:RND family efflux transporter MFP subunit
MNKQCIILTLIATTLFSMACNDSQKEKSGTLNDKKTALQSLIKEKKILDEKINTLRSEIETLEPGSGTSAKLVSVTTVSRQPFEHSIDLRGRIDADNISFITPRGMGGQVRAIYIKQGDYVSKGQLVLKLDDALPRQSLAAAREQLNTLKTQLSFAENIYTRQNNLWEKGIGTEVQVLSAKTNVETLMNQLNAAKEQVKVAEEQLNTTNVYSNVSGVVDVLNIHVGELFGSMGQIRVVNKSTLKAIANIPENYLNRVKKGTPVVVEIPDMGRRFETTISLIGQTIENTQRGFMAEAKIPGDDLLKPNQSAVIRIRDYAVASAIVIPINTVQNDETNKFVYILAKTGNGKTYASRRNVTLGESYGASVEIVSGLTGGEELITAGYQNLYEGQAISTVVN